MPRFLPARHEAFCGALDERWMDFGGCAVTGAAADNWHHILDWKLKPGSHAFPGPHGGTCINEAALIAAGFEYWRIHSVDQMPACFSRPLCRLAMMLNDDATDDERQRLLPYVTRLACADTPAVERRRAAYINWRTCFGFVAPRFATGLRMLDRALAMGRDAEAVPPVSVKARIGAAKATKRASGASASS
jgi:hypothetical protein